jgi:hypothetical protein
MKADKTSAAYISGFNDGYFVGIDQNQFEDLFEQKQYEFGFQDGAAEFNWEHEPPKQKKK